MTNNRQKSLQQFLLLLLLLFFCSPGTYAQTSSLLKGTVIGTEYSVDYNSGQRSTTVNTRDMAFDGKLDTYFASYDRSRTWVGLDLGCPHIITRVGWSPRNDGNGPRRVQLALFEGANQPDFSDAFPLFLNDVAGVIGKYQYADINVSKGFRYVRYVGPNDARCNIAEVEFYGYAGEGSDEQYYRPTNLPAVSIHVENAQEPYDKEHEMVCSVTLIPSAEGDTVKVKTGTVRLRGNASMSFPKKPYRIKFDKKHHVFGSPASARKWTLINNYGDKTLMRNILAFELSRRLEMEYTPFCVPVDLFVNGEYKGCYQLCDQIDVNKNRVNIEEMDETCIYNEELTGGYMVEVDAYANQETSWFNSKKGNPVTVKYPDADAIQKEQFGYIQSQFNMLEQNLYATNFTSESSYRMRLDLDSFLRHFLVGEISGNTDTYWSVNMFKHRNDTHFYTGPVWDFDLAFENDNRTHPINNHNDYVYTYGSCAGAMRNFVSRIIKSDSKAIDQLKELWETVRRWNGIDASSLAAYVDDTEELLEQSQRLNFMRWPILSSYVHQNWQASGSYSAEVKIVRDYLVSRIAWMDKKLGHDSNGIGEVETDIDTTSTEIYNLAGQRLDRPTKGVNIINGRKVVVK